jgi:hypothetical protein
VSAGEPKTGRVHLAFQAADRGNCSRHNAGMPDDHAHGFCLLQVNRNPLGQLAQIDSRRIRE